jgi:hypothetical protein
MRCMFHEVYPYSREIHAREVPAHKVYAHELHAYETHARCTPVRYTPIRYLFMRYMFMNLILEALLSPVCDDHSTLKPEMMDSSVLASAVPPHFCNRNRVRPAGPENVRLAAAG